MSVKPYLIFNGNCREAMDFYREVFGADEPVVMTYGDLPKGNDDFSLPPEAKSLVLHAEMTIAGDTIMFSDQFPGMPYNVGNHMSLAVISDDMDEIKSWFAKLKVGGQVEMELGETHWSKCYGSVFDRFGVSWQLNYSESETVQP